MIASNYHTHTVFVDGANTAEEMVQSALALGMHTLGFSEHAYTPLDAVCSLSETGTREYRREIARLQEKYAGQIQLLCGIEMDETSEDDPSAYDYVIGSVHYLTVRGKTYSVDASPEQTRLCIQEGFGGDVTAYARAYFERIGNVVSKTGAHIIGHFDLIAKFSEKGVGLESADPRYTDAWQAAMKQLAGKAALEINTGAMSRGWRTAPYPAAEMLRFWKQLGGETVINSDAHQRDTLLFAFDQAETLALQAGFHTLGFTDKKGVYHQQSGEKR